MSKLNMNVLGDYGYMADLLERRDGIAQEVNVIVRSVSRSGMSRVMSFYIANDMGSMVCIDGMIQKVLGYKRVRDGAGLRVSGCGMDMGFHVVDSLSWELFGEGYRFVSRTL